MDLNSVAESGQSESLQPGGAPIIHSTNQWLRRGAMDGFPASDGGLVDAPLHSNATPLSVVPAWPVLPEPSFAVAFLLFRESPTVGVGSSFTTAEGSVSPRVTPSSAVAARVWRSDARGVGSSLSVCSSGALSGFQRPPPPRARPSEATGVGSNFTIAVSRSSPPAPARLARL